jgi:hypothetical protein
MKLQKSIFVVACLAFIASPIFSAYADDPTSIILQPSQQSYYSIPAGKRAKVTDFKLYVDGVEHTEGFYPEYKPYKAPDLPKIGACRASAGRPSLPFSPPAPERPTSLPQ